MVFGFLTSTIENALDAAINSLEDLADGELPSSRNVATLIDAGLTVAAIASMYNVSDSIIERIAKGE